MLTNDESPYIVTIDYYLFCIASLTDKIRASNLEVYNRPSDSDNSDLTVAVLWGGW